MQARAEGLCRLGWGWNRFQGSSVMWLPCWCCSLTEGMFCGLQIWERAFPPASNTREQGKNGNAFHDRASELTYHPFHSIPLVTSGQPGFFVERDNRDVHTRR